MHTNFYHNQNFVRSEKLCTLTEFVEMDRLAPGQKILVAEVGKDKAGGSFSTNSETFWVGDCTPFEGPNQKSEDGWNERIFPMMKKYVIEVHTFQ